MPAERRRPDAMVEVDGRRRSVRRPRRAGRFLLLLALLYLAVIEALGQAQRRFIGPLGEPAKKPEEAAAGSVAGQEPDEPDEKPDWKDAAYQRQLDRINARKRKQSPDYKESAYERKVRLRKMAMWNAAQRKGVNEVGARDSTTIDIKVKLVKPFGIEFEEREEDPNRVWVGRILEEGSAFKNGEVETGDFLTTVNGQDVEGKPYDEALQYLVDAEGEIDLVFKRIYVA
ncbi:unnamed protein product [Symbiodinium sp. CCMP2592]|nr:unnamed protein product [Symbiodinium sp. CCMP2592]